MCRRFTHLCSGKLTTIPECLPRRSPRFDCVYQNCRCRVFVFSIRASASNLSYHRVARKLSAELFDFSRSRYRDGFVFEIPSSMVPVGVSVSCCKHFERVCSCKTRVWIVALGERDASNPSNGTATNRSESRSGSRARLLGNRCGFLRRRRRHP